MTHSICLRLICRSGHQIDLCCEEIPQSHSRLRVHPDPGSDDKIVIDWTIEGWGKASDAQGEVDDAVYRAATSEQIGKDDWNAVGVGDQTGLSLNNLALSHQKSFQGANTDLAKLNAKALGVQS